MVSADGDRFFIHLDGACDVDCEVARGDVIDAVHRMASVALELMTTVDDFRRMRNAVAAIGAPAIFAMGGLRVSGAKSRSKANRDVAVGLLARDDNVFAVGVGLPFGRVSAKQLSALCDQSEAANAAYVHTSPQRVIYFPVSSNADSIPFLRAAEALKLIARADDVRLMMDVCPGSPACQNARTDTRKDAQRFADSFSGTIAGQSLHISGCEKGCARNTSASFTFVGRDGRYDFIKNGSASSSDVFETIDVDGIGDAILRLNVESAT
jgi:precorrin-3B synthase